MGVVMIVFGIVAILTALAANKFYPSFMRAPRLGEKPAPKWRGRLLLVLIGLCFIYSCYVQPSVGMIVAAIIGIVTALTANQSYRGLSIMRAPSPGEKPETEWVGRLYLVVIGLCLIYSGYVQLRHR